MAKSSGFAALATLKTTAPETSQDDVTPAQPTFDAPQDDTPVAAPAERVLNDLPVIEWTTAELEAYIAGTTAEETYVATIKEAIREHRIRETTLPKAWTAAECRAFFKDGTTPEQTTKGAWVNDETRKDRREYEWTTEELESWALGEISPEGSTTRGGLAVELKQRLKLQVPGSDPDTIIANYRFVTKQVAEVIPSMAKLATTLTEITPVETTTIAQSVQLEGVTPVNQSYIDSSLAQFESVMKPGKAVSEKAGGEAQRLLRDVIMYAVRLNDPVGAHSAMKYLLDYFAARRGIGQIFEDTYAYRNIPDMPTTKKEQVAHHDLLTLFLVYADPMVELRGQTDIPSLIGKVQPAYQSRLLEFFSRS